MDHHFTPPYQKVVCCNGPQTEDFGETSLNYENRIFCIRLNCSGRLGLEIIEVISMVGLKKSQFLNFPPFFVVVDRASHYTHAADAVTTPIHPFWMPE
jgi:hypothetical protein